MEPLRSYLTTTGWKQDYEKTRPLFKPTGTLLFLLTGAYFHAKGIEYAFDGEVGHSILNTTVATLNYTGAFFLLGKYIDDKRSKNTRKKQLDEKQQNLETKLS
ncbi:hypothetical protein COV93_01540 [Candidatus Woesearchaeota archaeon CG11_big_fil_rev_8_21_14_0_20_43_8]|nr:MAG: hypothetical protein COV93_01540 [Candidatus Woesearchaeota archaeon CG11_big_fil_rev_8_21_14_0_20_43_8]PIO05460.1 MAG: hypothetical protein COT47_04700 [Candidatus Woesearchaeota archaeon CG08_land_8_20_14_0_20_43_7]